MEKTVVAGAARRVNVVVTGSDNRCPHDVWQLTLNVTGEAEVVMDLVASVAAGHVDRHVEEEVARWPYQ
jgi:hypothetical protein